MYQSSFADVSSLWQITYTDLLGTLNDKSMDVERTEMKVQPKDIGDESAHDAVIETRTIGVDDAKQVSSYEQSEYQGY